MTHAEIYRAARGYLTTLPPSQRAILKLRYRAGLTFAEIADKLKQVSGQRYGQASTVKVLHDKAIRILEARFHAGCQIHHPDFSEEVDAITFGKDEE